MEITNRRMQGKRLLYMFMQRKNKDIISRGTEQEFIEYIETKISLRISFFFGDPQDMHEKAQKNQGKQKTQNSRCQNCCHQSLHTAVTLSISQTGTE